MCPLCKVPWCRRIDDEPASALLTDSDESGFDSDLDRKVVIVKGRRKLGRFSARFGNPVTRNIMKFGCFRASKHPKWVAATHSNDARRPFEGPRVNPKPEPEEGDVEMQPLLYHYDDEKAEVSDSGVLQCGGLALPSLYDDTHLPADDEEVKIMADYGIEVEEKDEERAARCLALHEHHGAYHRAVTLATPVESSMFLFCHLLKLLMTLMCRPLSSHGNMHRTLKTELLTHLLLVAQVHLKSLLTC